MAVGIEVGSNGLAFLTVNNYGDGRSSDISCARSTSEATGSHLGYRLYFQELVDVEICVCSRSGVARHIQHDDLFLIETSVAVLHEVGLIQHRCQHDEQ